MHLCCATAAQPERQHHKSGLPDISELEPHLQQEWHPDNNALLGGIKVKPRSGRRVMWTCPNCPAGCPHIWLAVVSNRTAGTGCPYCQGRKVCKHNSLATKAPKQTRYWDHDKNAKALEQTLAGSQLRADWKCPDCSYEWQARVMTRVYRDAGCPRCSYKHKKQSRQPTFQDEQHSLLLEWDQERNALDGIFPHKTTLKSDKLVHWVCHKCPKGQLHRYQMRAGNRTGKHAHGCPYCAGRRACSCNSLAACSPDIAAEWDFAKNDRSPADVTLRSHEVVWWSSASRGSWKQRINDRTDFRSPAKVSKDVFAISFTTILWVITAAVFSTDFPACSPKRLHQVMFSCKLPELVLLLAVHHNCWTITTGRISHSLICSLTAMSDHENR